MFEGIMKKELFVEILSGTLLPFVNETYPSGHRFMQDNDPKHTSGYADQWMKDNGINWWKTPAESPDLNPIENLWHELKEYIRREVKPKTKDELIDGIIEFWSTMQEVHKTPNKSNIKSYRTKWCYYWLLRSNVCVVVKLLHWFLNVYKLVLLMLDTFSTTVRILAENARNEGTA